MRILICTKLDLTSCIAVNELLASFKKDEHEWQLVLSDKVNEAERSLPAQHDLAFYERDMFLLWSKGIQDQGQLYLPFHLLKNRYQLEDQVLKNINTDTRFLHRIAVWKPDVIVSIRYNYIFKQPIIDLAQRAVVNLHPGKLPEYGGFFAPFWAMKNGEHKLVSTLHGISNEQIDSGDIYAQTSMEVVDERSVMWHFTELYKKGIPSLVGLLRDVGSHLKVQGQIQDLDNQTLFTHPREQDLRQLESLGFTLVGHEDYLEQCGLFFR